MKRTVDEHLNGPHGFAELSDGGRRIEDDFGSIEPKCQPIQRVVPPITNVHRNPSVGSLKHRVPGVPFHVVGALIEVSNPRYVILVKKKKKIVRSMHVGKNLEPQIEERGEDSTPFDACR